MIERSVGRTSLIRANLGNPLTNPLREILIVGAGSAALMMEELGRINGAESAFLYGSFAARLLGVEGAAPNDIDVMVIGTPDASEV